MYIRYLISEAILQRGTVVLFFNVVGFKIILVCVTLLNGINYKVAMLPIKIRNVSLPE